MPLTIRRRLVDRVRQWRKIAYAVCVGLVVLAGAVVFLSVSSPGSSVEVVSDTTFFDSNRALRWAEAYGHACTPSGPWAPTTAEGVINWFEEKLPDPDMAEVDSFEAPMGDRRSRCATSPWCCRERAKRPSSSPPPGIRPTVVKVEPLAYTSGTAMLLELIQVFNARPHQKTLVFLSTEDESTGGRGHRAFPRHQPPRRRTSPPSSPSRSWAESGPKSLKARRDGPPEHHARAGTCSWSARCLAKAGLELDVPGLLSQAADHALSLSRGDQVAGLNRGIASLRLYDDGTGNPIGARSGDSRRRYRAADPLPRHRHRGPARSGHGPAPQVRPLPHQPGHHPAGRAHAPAHARRSLHLAVLVPHQRRGPPSGICATSCRSRCRSRFLFLIAYLLARAGLIPLYRFQVPTTDGPSTQPGWPPRSS